MTRKKTQKTHILKVLIMNERGNIERREFIIVGSNNFWYSSFHSSSWDKAEEQLPLLKREIEDDWYEDGGTPETLHLYEVLKHKEFST